MSELQSPEIQLFVRREEHGLPGYHRDFYREGFGFGTISEIPRAFDENNPDTFVIESFLITPLSTDLHRPLHLYTEQLSSDLEVLEDDKLTESIIAEGMRKFLASQE